MSETLTPPSPAANAAIKKRTVVAWSLWDWGSAAFNAVVTTFVFTVYLTSGLFGDSDEVSGQLAFAVAIAGLLIALLAPVLGQRSDRAGKRKFWLGVNTFIVVAITAALWFVEASPSYLVLGLFLIAAGNIFFEIASVNYYAMLSQVSTRDNVGRVSGFGWGMGYIGGIVLLAIILVGFIFPVSDGGTGWFGVTSENGQNVRAAMLLAAVWFGLSALPVLFAVPEIPKTASSEKPAGFFTSYVLLIRSIAELWRERRAVVYFLIASAVFRDGLSGVFTFGGVLAAVSFGFSSSTVIVFAIAANLVAGVATFIGGIIDDRVGPKPVMVFSLIAMVICAMVIFFLADQGAWVFWVFGLMLCLFVGPVQSASRSFLSRTIPPGKEGEVFGLYATTGRAVSFLAPLFFGVFVAVSGQTLFGIFGIALVLLIGLLLLLPVRNSWHVGTEAPETEAASS
ncbi:MAG: MFS transporter [Microbacteriaceae bacterium]|nr:MFS transporter [Microbacteriaceae bacterium]